MRKLFFLLLSIWLSGPSCAQTSYTMSFDPGDFNLSQNGGLTSVTSSLIEEREFGGSQFPALPYYPMRILLPGIRTAKIHVK